MIGVSRAGHQFQIDLDGHMPRDHLQRFDERGDRGLGRDLAILTVKRDGHRENWGMRSGEWGMGN